LALKQHFDDKVRFDQQVDNSQSYVMPFIEKTKTLQSGTNVMEVGSGEGGVLLPFINKECYCVGVDLDAKRIDIANDFLGKEIAAGKAKFLCQNIYDEDFLKQYGGFFDIIILKDVIEHVPEQEKFIPYLKKLLKPGGQIFFGFPPWYMPFGGHQQLMHVKWASMLPYFHILPRSVYKAFLKMTGEKEYIVNDLLDIYDTRITIERFERIVKKSGLQVVNKQHYLINPIYKYKFGLTPLKQWAPLSWIPYFRDFVTTCVYYTVQ
jgi:2-polyprenyl-3-methyl-5-hydroxy-6-metoxy-1,4-benzoquinol methylase